MKNIQLIPVFLWTILLLLGCSDDKDNYQDNNKKTIPEFPADPAENPDYLPGNSADILINDPVKLNLDRVLVTTNQAINHDCSDDCPEKLCDGDLTTKYHSYERTDISWPLQITGQLPGDTPEFDYFVYYPRQTGGTNGILQEGSFLISLHETGDDWIKLTDIINKTESRAPVRIYIPEAYKGQVRRFRIEATAGVGNFICISEVEFYQQGQNLTQIPDIFENQAATRLKAGTTTADIEALSNTFFRNMAFAIQNGTYNSFRINHCQAYLHPQIMSDYNKTSTYGLLDNVTGIYFKENEEVVVFVDGPLNYHLYLRIIDHNGNTSSTFEGQQVELYPGINKFKANRNGLAYLLYHYDEPGQPEHTVTVNFTTGQVNGYFDPTLHTQADWEKMISKAVWNRFDLKGKYALLTFTTGDLLTQTQDPFRLLQLYDSIVYLEEEFSGLFKYNRAHKSRMYLDASPYPAYMHATSYRTEYTLSTMPDLCNPEKLRTEACWGPAHEIGHINQLRPDVRWGETGETTNNIFSLYVQKTFGNISRLEEEPEKKVHAFNAFFVKGAKVLDPQDEEDLIHWDMLLAFWQLQLYFADVLGQKEFYMDVFEKVRQNDTKEGLEATNDFAWFCCEVSGYDLSDFFTRWGYELTQDTRNKIRQAGLKKMEQAIEYIQDCNVELYKNTTSGCGGKFSISTSNKILSIEGPKNIVAYEVYNGNQLDYIDINPSFSYDARNKEVIVKAIDSNGTRFELEEMK